MIRINLLPHKTVRKKKTPGQGPLLAIALSCLAAVAANYTYYVGKADLIKSQKSTISKQTREITDLKNAIGKVESYQAEKKKIEEQLKVLHTLEQGRSGPVKMLDALAASVPKNVWLTSLKEANSTIDISGEALSNEDVSSFMKLLKESVWTPVGIGRVLSSDQPSKESTIQHVELLPSGDRRDFPSEKLHHFFSDIALGKTSATGSGSESFTISFKVNYTK